MKYVWLKRWMQTSNWNLFVAVLGDGVLWCVCINLYFAAFGGKGSADPWGRPLIRKMLQGLNFESSQMNHVIQLMASETGGETTPNFLWQVGIHRFKCLEKQGQTLSIEARKLKTAANLRPSSQQNLPWTSLILDEYWSYFLLVSSFPMLESACKASNKVRSPNLGLPWSRKRVEFPISSSCVATAEQVPQRVCSINTEIVFLHPNTENIYCDTHPCQHYLFANLRLKIF